MTASTPHFQRCAPAPAAGGRPGSPRWPARRRAPRVSPALQVPRVAWPPRDPGPAAAAAVPPPAAARRAARRSACAAAVHQLARPTAARRHDPGHARGRGRAALSGTSSRQTRCLPQRFGGTVHTCQRRVCHPRADHARAASARPDRRAYGPCSCAHRLMAIQVICRQTHSTQHFSALRASCKETQAGLGAVEHAHCEKVLSTRNFAVPELPSALSCAPDLVIALRLAPDIAPRPRR